MTRFYKLLVILMALSCGAAMAQDSVVRKQPAPPPALADILAAQQHQQQKEPPAAMPMATAAPIPPLDPAKFPVLAKIKEQGKDVSYDYLGQRLGLDVWLVSGPGAMQLVYTLPNNAGAIIGGNLIDAEGKELSQAMQQDFITKNPVRAEEMIALVQKGQQQTSAPDTAPEAILTPSQKIWQQLQTQTTPIMFGDDAAPVLYAVLDPFQPATKGLWPTLLAKAEAKQIKLAVLPLAATDPKTIDQIVAALNSEDKGDAWRKLIASDLGFIKTAPQSTDGVMALKQNIDLMQALQLRQLPLLLYKTSGDKMRLVRGAPKDWAALWVDMGVAQ